MTKQAARTTYLSRRMALTGQERLVLSAGLLEQFSKVAWGPLQTVHVYQPIPAKNEIDTRPFVQYLEARFKGLTLVVPRIRKDADLEHVVWDAGTAFNIGPWGIPEPFAGLTVSPEDIDLVLVPLLIFDKEGYRVGYGKGFYDRFLSACRPDVIKVGLSWFEPLPRLADRAVFDVPLSIGVTPTQLYEFV